MIHNSIRNNKSMQIVLDILTIMLILAILFVVLQPVIAPIC